MTNHATPDIDPKGPLTTDEQLQEALAFLLRNAAMRRMWMLVLGADGRLLDPLLPMTGLPESPDETADTDDLGVVPSARLLAERAGMVCEALEGEALVLVWERPGPEAFGSSDRAWAAAMAGQVREHGPRLRAQFVLHDSGIRRITADDWL